MVHIRVQIAVRSLLSLQSTFRILLLQQRTSTKERKDQHPIPANSLSHFAQKDIYPKHKPRRW